MRQIVGGRLPELAVRSSLGAGAGDLRRSAHGGLAAMLAPTRWFGRIEPMKVLRVE